MTDTTSWFQKQGERAAPRVIRRFIVGSDDYSERVLKWPTISTDYKRVRPGRVSVRLANHDQYLNKFITDKTNLTKVCQLDFGYPAEGADFIQSTILPKRQPELYEFYGICVSLTGSGNYAAIGNTGASSQSYQGGAVEIYKRNPSRWKDKLSDTWNLHQVLFDPVSWGYHYYGAIHDFSDDGNYLFVGQQRYAGSVGSAGIVYAYKYNSTSDTYGYLASFQPGSSSQNANFGHSVSTNEDGSKVIVGAPRHATIASSGPIGAAYIFVSSTNGTWNEIQKLGGSNISNSGDWFGECVKMAPNGSRCAAVAPFIENYIDASQGEMYLFTESSNGFWTETSTHCIGNEPVDRHTLGYGTNSYQSKMIGMNYKGTEIIVGAPLAPYLLTGGACYLFVESVNGYIGLQHQKIEYSNPSSGMSSGSSGHQFGGSVFMSHSGDIAIIGNQGYSFNSTLNGANHIFRRSAVNSLFEQVTYYNVPGISASAQLGAITDGSKYGDTFITGAPYENSYYGVETPSADYGQAFIYVSSEIPSSYSAEETVTLFKGTTDSIAFGNNMATLSMQDRMKNLQDRYVGTEESPVTFTNSSLPSDIFWTAVTCYGGYSSITSTSNPDIDYEAYYNWAERFSLDSLFMNAEFKGVRVLEVLSKLARMTDSTIITERDKLFVKRWSAAESIMQDFNLNNSQITIDIATDNLINNQYVKGLYDTNSKSYGIQVLVVDSASVGDYGIKEHKEEDQALWFVSSAACVNLAQRKVVFNRVPLEDVKISTYLPGLSRHIGDTISTTNSVYNHNISLSRVIGNAVNMDSGNVTIKSDPSLLLAGFVLDTDALDATSKFLT